MIRIHNTNPWYESMIRTHDTNPWYEPVIRIHDTNPWYEPIHRAQFRVLFTLCLKSPSSEANSGYFSIRVWKLRARGCRKRTPLQPQHVFEVATDTNPGYESWIRIIDTNPGYEPWIRTLDTNPGCERWIQTLNAPKYKRPLRGPGCRTPCGIVFTLSLTSTTTLKFMHQLLGKYFQIVLLHYVHIYIYIYIYIHTYYRSFA